MKMGIGSVGGFALFLSCVTLVSPCFGADTVATSVTAPVGQPQPIPLQPQPAFFSPAAGLIQFRCKDMRLWARSKISPSVTYELTDGLFNDKDCKSSIKSLQDKGCFCDADELKCMETKKIEPFHIVCPQSFLCFEVRGERKGLFQVVSLGRYVTRKVCEQELAILERSVTQ